ncbi:prephenate dehydrogenase [Bellilinea caldifistulae]|uniref:prephenate dehydrogenase n=1 Tax=Bellilinea caldifistulae TaxID=360411 RepID=UPI000783EC8F|nr:prephenate dehydrogenase [Bellilinea caldifistulae]GAP09337.1 prephenate dehydrogenase [Bellilinea caldifistulae]
MAEDPHFERSLAHQTVAIVGLGLMGGSLALALRGRCAGLLGVDHNPAVVEQAAGMGLADRVGTSFADILPQAGLIILATPLSAILRLLEDLPGLHPGPAVVLDLGSTKSAVVEKMAGLPPRFDPLGGHPMCGKERSSLDEAEAGLYHGAPFALTPLGRTSPAARRLAEELVDAVGARPVWLEAEEHDAVVAATSHLPYLTAAALAGITPLQAGVLVGPGFRSTTRLAETPLSIMLDILRYNRPNLLSGLQRLQRQMAYLSRLLEAEDYPALAAELEQAARRRVELTRALAEDER